MTTPPVGYNQDTNFYSGTPLYGADYAAGTNSTISYTMSGNISDMSGGVACTRQTPAFFLGATARLLVTTLQAYHTAHLMVAVGYPTTILP